MSKLKFKDLTLYPLWIDTFMVEDEDDNITFNFLVKHPNKPNEEFYLQLIYDFCHTNNTPWHYKFAKHYSEFKKPWWEQNTFSNFDDVEIDVKEFENYILNDIFHCNDIENLHFGYFTALMQVYTECLKYASHSDQTYIVPSLDDKFTKYIHSALSDFKYSVPNFERKYAGNDRHMIAGFLGMRYYDEDYER